MAVVRRESRVVFYPDNAKAWNELVNLEIFSGFFPGISLEQAKLKHGNPDSHGVNSLGRYWRYQGPQGIVHLGLEDQSSPPILLPDVWILRVYPADPAPDNWMHPSVVAYLPEGANGNVDVVVMNNCGYPGVEILMRNGQVELITWIENTGSFDTGR